MNELGNCSSFFKYAYKYKNTKKRRESIYEKGNKSFYAKKKINIKIKYQIQNDEIVF